MRLFSVQPELAVQVDHIERVRTPASRCQDPHRNDGWCTWQWHGKRRLGEPVLIKEVDFLESAIVPDAPEDDSEGARERDAVGRIDTVLVHPDKPNEWWRSNCRRCPAPAVIPSRTISVGLSPGVSRKAAEKSGLDLKVLNGRWRKAAIPNIGCVRCGTC